MDTYTVALLALVALLLAVILWELRTTRRETTHALYWLAGKAPLEDDGEPEDLLRPNGRPNQIVVPRAGAPCHNLHRILPDGTTCPECRRVI